MSYALKTFTTSYRWDTDENGDPLEFPTDLGTEEEEHNLNRDPDDDVTEVTTRTADWISHHLGSVEPSSWPNFQAEVWYSAVDPYVHPYTGVTESVTVHLEGYSSDEQRDIFEALTSA